MNRLIFSIVIVSLIVFISCESEDAEDVNQQKISTNYYLSYDKGLDETDVRAEFTFGSTYLRLNAPSAIVFENDVLSEKEVLGIVGYTRTYPGLVDYGTFSYTNQEETTYRNTLEMVNSIAPPEISTLSASEGGTISWIGKPLGEGEIVHLLITTSKSSSSRSVNAVNATRIIIEPMELLAESIGEDASIQLERSKRRFLDAAPDEGGYGTVSYKSVKMAIEIVE